MIEVGRRIRKFPAAAVIAGLVFLAFSCHGILRAETKGKSAPLSPSWTSILANPEKQSADTYFELGVRYYKEEKPGQSALMFRRALLLESDFPEARQNLSVVEEKTGALVRETDWWDRWFHREAANHWLIAASAAFWFVLFGVALLLIQKRRHGLLWTTMVLSLAVLGGSVTGYVLSRTRDLHDNHITMLRNGNSVLSAPASAATPLLELPAASEARVLEEHGPWFYIETIEESPVRGWVRKEWVGRLWN